jgi:hypothetical protein
LSKVEEAFRLAARTTSVVRQNLFWACFYNALGITLTITEVLSPVLAAIAMLLSSTSAVANSMRLTRPERRQQSQYGTMRFNYATYAWRRLCRSCDGSPRDAAKGRARFASRAS